MPSSVWIIGEDVDGKRALLAGVPDWPTGVEDGWFSTDEEEGRHLRAVVG